MIAGVTPPGFFGVDPAAFLPMHSNLVVESLTQYRPKEEDYLDKNLYWIEAMGRLRPGVSLTEAQATLAPAFANWVATTASNDAERASF